MYRSDEWRKVTKAKITAILGTGSSKLAVILPVFAIFVPLAVVVEMKFNKTGPGCPQRCL